MDKIIVTDTKQVEEMSRRA